MLGVFVLKFLCENCLPLFIGGRGCPSWCWFVFWLEDRLVNSITSFLQCVCCVTRISELQLPPLLLSGAKDINVTCYLGTLMSTTCRRPWDDGVWDQKIHIWPLGKQLLQDFFKGIYLVTTSNTSCLLVSTTKWDMVLTVSREGFCSVKILKIPDVPWPSPQGPRPAKTPWSTWHMQVWTRWVPGNGCVFIRVSYRKWEICLKGEG